MPVVLISSPENGSMSIRWGEVKDRYTGQWPSKLIGQIDMDGKPSGTSIGFPVADPRIQEEEQPPMRRIVLGSGNKPQQDAFMADYHNATSTHPINPRARLTSNASTMVSPFGRGIRIGDIMSLQPGQGGGKEALALLCQLADKHGLKLELTAKNYGHDDRLSTEQLRGWYMRYGFVDDREGADDYSGDDEEGWDMVRFPA